jgi:alkaline phosphatase D
MKELAAVLSIAVSLQAGLAADPPLPSGPITRLAFGSCAKHWQAQPIWEGVLEHQPDLWLYLGDAIYADTDGTTVWEISEGQLTGEWNRLADKPEWQAFRATVPMLATWDNHDYGSHAGGGEFAHKEIARKAFLTFFNAPKTSPRWTRDGIYDATVIGPEGKRLQIILLDTKFNRSRFRPDPTPKAARLKAGKVGSYSPDTDPTKTHLGAAQWQWLEAQLKEPAELRLLCSSTQVIPDQKGMDEWGNFPHERQRLLALCKQAGNVIILSGNVHFAEVSETPDGTISEFSSSGMTHINALYANAPNHYRVAGPVIALNTGLVEIEWGNSPKVSLQAIGVDGKIEFAHNVIVNTDHGAHP